MKNKAVSVIIIVLILALGAYIITRDGKVKMGAPVDEATYVVPKVDYQSTSTRKPIEGCAWKPYVVDRLGFAMNVLDCKDNDFSDTTFVDSANVIFQVSKADVKNPDKGVKMIEVYEKDAAKSMEAIIKENFISRLTGDEKTGCAVTSNFELSSKNKDRVRYAIRPTGSYVAKAQALRVKDAGKMICGEYGQGDVIGYFEFQTATPSKYAFIRVVPEIGLFDEDTIQLSKGAQVE